MPKAKHPRGAGFGDGDGDVISDSRLLFAALRDINSSEVLQDLDEKKKALFRRHQHLILSLANKCVRMGVKQEIEDLVQIGAKALLGAIEKFVGNWKNGPKLSTYAYNCILGQMLHESPRESTVSLDERTAGDDEPMSLLDRLAADVRPADACLEDAELWRIADTLPPRWRAVIRGRFLEDLTLAETGRRLGMTKQGAEQIEKKALAMLRTKLAAIDGWCPPPAA